ncbi:MAG: hypothetical protein JST33_03170 [Actinobacteria bacterium]|nr:hypothetical protein [Actinomycetota bacterium]
MSTSDQHQLTRKQLRESRLTGSTPIVAPEDAEAARLAASAAVEPIPGPDVEEPLTRRQMREQERIRTGATPVVEQSAPVAPERPAPIPERPAMPATPVPVASSPAPVASAPAVTASDASASVPAVAAEMITDVPRAAQPTRRRSYAPSADLDEQDGVDDAEGAAAPVSVFSMMRAQDEAGQALPAAPVAAEQPAAPVPSAPAAVQETAPVEPAVKVPSAPATPRAEATSAAAPVSAEPSLESLFGDADEALVRAEDGAEPTVNAGFGQRVLAQHQPAAPKADSFDALIGDSTGSHHAAPNALIFQQAPSALSLSGPVASTGEILVTGSYELPAGLGSRGHADGMADGKEVDAVLVDGELAPASSPTPIAASAAIGTIKPAGEVIRPPEPEKGNKLMLALTITAGALAVALVGALIVAITTGAFSS